MIKIQPKYRDTVLIMGAKLLGFSLGVWGSLLWINSKINSDNVKYTFIESENMQQLLGLSVGLCLMYVILGKRKKRSRTSYSMIDQGLQSLIFTAVSNVAVADLITDNSWFKSLDVKYLYGGFDYQSVLLGFFMAIVVIMLYWGINTLFDLDIGFNMKRRSSKIT